MSARPAKAPSRMATADCAIQLDDRRGFGLQQHVVEDHDLAPVRGSAWGACACTAAIAAWSVYGPMRLDDNALSTNFDPSAI